MRSSRLGRSSCASIESEASIASTTSMPSVRTRFVPVPQRGPENASAARPSAAETRNALATGARRTPGGARRSIAASAPSFDSRAHAPPVPEPERERRHEREQRRRDRGPRKVESEVHGLLTATAPARRGARVRAATPRARRRAASDTARGTARSASRESASARARRSASRCAGAPGHPSRGSTGRPVVCAMNSSSGSSSSTARVS